MKTKEIEYIFDLINSELNLCLFNDNQKALLEFKDSCYDALDKSRMINMFHGNTLLAYDTALRLYANIIFEKIPTEQKIDISQIPEIDEFKNWFGSLEFDDFILICFYLMDQKLITITTDEDLQFTINVFITNRELTYVQPNQKY